MLDPARAGTWPLRLGHAWSALGEHTTTLLRRWQQDHPDVRWSCCGSTTRTGGLARGRVDVAILRGPVDLPGVHVEPLLTEARVAAVPRDSPLAGRAALGLADLAAHPIALNSLSGTTTLDLWPPEQTPADRVEVANTDDWLAAITAGRAVGVTTEATAAMHPHPAVTYVPLTDAPTVTVHLAWRQPPSHPAVLDLCPRPLVPFGALSGVSRGSGAGRHEVRGHEWGTFRQAAELLAERDPVMARLVAERAGAADSVVEGEQLRVAGTRDRLPAVGPARRGGDPRPADRRRGR